MRLLALLVFTAALAGCMRPAEGGGGGPSGFTFDGEGAFEAVRLLVERPDGSPRFRVPGTAGHAEAAQVLHDAMAATGWATRWQNFTGEDYEALDKDGVSLFAESPAYCREPDRAELAALPFHNLVATWPGDGGRTLWLGAHWESKEEASQDPDEPAAPVLGANDGASGVGLLLRLMRHVADGEVELPYGLGVVFFDGEDGFEDCHPLAGSLYFVDRLAPGEADRFLLLDMVGDPAARFPREARSVEGDPALVELLWRHADAGPLAENFVDAGHGVIDDHLPFLAAGIPAVDVIDYARDGVARFPPYWHTRGDTLDNLSPQMLGRMGDLLAAVLRDPEFTARWP